MRLSLPPAMLLGEEKKAREDDDDASCSVSNMNSVIYRPRPRGEGIV